MSFVFLFVLKLVFLFHLHRVILRSFSGRFISAYLSTPQQPPVNSSNGKLLVQHLFTCSPLDPSWTTIDFRASALSVSQVKLKLSIGGEVSQSLQRQKPHWTSWTCFVGREEGVGWTWKKQFLAGLAWRDCEKDLRHCKIWYPPTPYHLHKS